MLFAYSMGDFVGYTVLFLAVLIMLARKAGEANPEVNDAAKESGGEQSDSTDRSLFQVNHAGGDSPSPPLFLEKSFFDEEWSHVELHIHFLHRPHSYWADYRHCPGPVPQEERR